jgi:hypothetical protein
MRRAQVFLISLFAVLAIGIWASDRITLQGERTIHTVACEGGAWDGLRCTGHLVAADRYRFRSSHARNEVLYWIAGSKAPSGKFTDCRVQDRDNWTCNVESGQPPSIAHELSGGRPTSHLNGIDASFHAVSKGKWWALSSGILAFTDADYSSDSGSPPPMR